MGWFILFLSLIVVISSGIATGLGYSPRPRPLGWALFIVGGIVGIFTVDGWARVLPGVFGIATLNGLIILMSGHALNQPAVPVARPIGFLLTLVMAGASFITSSSADRHLTIIDRTAYLGILACFVGMMVSVMGSIAGWELPVCIGFVCVVVVLWVRRFMIVRTRGFRI
jgi:hypothetical protein